MRWTLTLLIANLLAIAWITHTHYQSAESLMSLRIFPMEAGDVIALKIESRTAGTVALKKRGQTWWLEAPIEWAANPFAVQRIINQILFIQRDISFSTDELQASGKTLTEYGLEEPALSLTLQTAHTTHQLLLGAPTGMGSKLYALQPDEKRISVLANENFEGLSIDLESLRSDAIFDLPLYSIDSIVIKMRDPDITLRLSRQKDNWVFESPIITQADNERVNALLNLLSSLKAVDFLSAESDALPNRNLDNAAMRISLRGKNGQQTLLVGEQASVSESGVQRNYARLENTPTVFTVIGDPFDALKSRWEHLREHRILPSDLGNNITTLEIRKQGQKVILQKLETGPWQILREQDDKQLETLRANDEAVLGMVNHIALLEALNFVSDAPSKKDLQDYGLDPAHGEITLRSNDRTLRVLLGNLSADKALRYVMTSETQSVFGVREFSIEVIEAESYPYRSLVLMTQPESAVIDSLTLTPLRDANNARRISAQAEKSPANEADAQLWEALQPHLNPFMVKNFVAGNATQEHLHLRGSENSIPWTHTLDFEVKLPSGDKTQLKNHRFYLSSLENPVYAAYEGNGQPFILPEKLISLLKQILPQEP